MIDNTVKNKRKNTAVKGYNDGQKAELNLNNSKGPMKMQIQRNSTKIKNTEDENKEQNRRQRTSYKCKINDQRQKKNLKGRGHCKGQKVEK